jgi:hypothetical protein
MNRICNIVRENPAVACVVVAILAALAGTAIRYWFYEPDTFGAICYAENPWWCVFRTFVAVMSKYSLFGWIAEALALLAIVRAFMHRPATVLAYAAIVVGGMGLILYDATVSTPAVLIGVILLVRAPERSTL